MFREGCWRHVRSRQASFYNCRLSGMIACMCIYTHYPCKTMTCHNQYNDVNYFRHHHPLLWRNRNNVICHFTTVDYSFNCLFRLMTNTEYKLRIVISLWGKKHLWTFKFPHQRPLMRKEFQYHDIIILIVISKTVAPSEKSESNLQIEITSCMLCVWLHGKVINLLGYYQPAPGTCSFANLIELCNLIKHVHGIDHE